MAIKISVMEPYDFQLSLKAVNSFSRSPESEPQQLRIGARIEFQPVVLTIRAGQESPGCLLVSCSDPRMEQQAAEIARWALFADLALESFYMLANQHTVFSSLVKKLNGLKPMRPASLLEMAVIVITEQQISLAAANTIRGRLAQRFGDELDGLLIFPEARTLAQASLEDLRSCGYSQRKAEYIRGFAGMVVDGSLDLEKIKSMADEDVRSTLVAVRGWGNWSANYFLIRGLARPDAVPSDDLALRSALGKTLGGGTRIAEEQALELLAPFAPYRGIAAFYLLANEFLNKKSQPG